MCVVVGCIFGAAPFHSWRRFIRRMPLPSVVSPCPPHTLAPQTNAWGPQILGSYARSGGQFGVSNALFNVFIFAAELVDETTCRVAISAARSIVFGSTPPTEASTASARRLSHIMQGPFAVQVLSIQTKPLVSRPTCAGLCFRTGLLPFLRCASINAHYSARLALWLGRTADDDSCFGCALRGNRRVAKV